MELSATQPEVTSDEHMKVVWRRGGSLSGRGTWVNKYPAPAINKIPTKPTAKKARRQRQKMLRRTPSGPTLRAARGERRPEAAEPRVEGDMVESDQAERAGFNKKVRAK